MRGTKLSVHEAWTWIMRGRGHRTGLTFERLTLHGGRSYLGVAEMRDVIGGEAAKLMKRSASEIEILHPNTSRVSRPRILDPRPCLNCLKTVLQGSEERGQGRLSVSVSLEWSPQT
jgi:hypothetical protein